MITLVARPETTQLPFELERNLWRQLRGAFGAQRVIFAELDDQMLEALFRAGDAERIFLEPTGHKSITNIPKDGDIVIITGNTAMNNLRFVRPEDAYRINCENPKSHLYGINAAAIALAIRYGQ